MLGFVHAGGCERAAFVLEVVHRRFCGAQQQRGNAVGEHAVDLFRHGWVVLLGGVSETCGDSIHDAGLIAMA